MLFYHNASSTEYIVDTFALAWAVYHITLGFHILRNLQNYLNAIFSEINGQFEMIMQYVMECFNISIMLFALINVALHFV